MTNEFSRFRKDEKGATAIEYGLIMTLSASRRSATFPCLAAISV